MLRWSTHFIRFIVSWFQFQDFVPTRRTLQSGQSVCQDGWWNKMNKQCKKYLLPPLSESFIPFMGIKLELFVCLAILPFLWHSHGRQDAVSKWTHPMKVLKTVLASSRRQSPALSCLTLPHSIYKKSKKAICAKTTTSLQENKEQREFWTGWPNCPPVDQLPMKTDENNFLSRLFNGNCCIAGLTRCKQPDERSHDFRCHKWSLHWQVWSQSGRNVCSTNLHNGSTQCAHDMVFRTSKWWLNNTCVVFRPSASFWSQTLNCINLLTLPPNHWVSTLFDHQRMRLVLSVTVLLPQKHLALNKWRICVALFGNCR